MSGFPALNIEPEVDNIEEVDDTREIQLEEALKLYQNALRLHSLGPEYLDQAANAYTELFNSEIFRYPEAISEFTRDELDNSPGAALIVDQSLPQVNLVQGATTEASPSSLPQIIYLSFKNYGQFLLEQDAFANSQYDSPDGSKNASSQDIILICSKALKKFAQALERDDTDLDLWRKAARVAQICSSDRTIRFCLESVLAGDDDRANEVVEILGLDEALAAGQLEDIVGNLEDDLSFIQACSNKPRKDLLRLLGKTIEPFPFLPSQSHLSRDRDPQRRTPAYQPKRWVVQATTRSWHGVGQAILQALNDEQESNIDPGPGAAVQIDVPAEPELSERSKMDIGSFPSKVESRKAREASGRDSGMTDGAAQPSTDFVLSVDTETVTPLEGDSLPDPALDVVMDSSKVEGSSKRATEICQGDEIKKEGGQTCLPTRKRSAEFAGHDEPVDNGRSKSKRLRNRESNADAILQEEETANTLAKYYQDQLSDLALADQWLFSTRASLLSKLGVDELGSLEDLRNDILHASNVEDFSDTELSADAIAMKDLRSALSSWTDEKASAAAYGYGGSTFGGGKAGLTLFLEHSKTAIPRSDSILPFSSSKDLSQFIGRCNEGWYSIQQTAFDWLEALIQPSVSYDAAGSSNCLTQSSYKTTLWPEDMKSTVVQLVVRVDEYIYQVMQQRLNELVSRMLSIAQGSSPEYTLRDVAIADAAETLYELHLDIYFRITNPSSQVDSATRVLQHDRLQRWSELAGSFINIYADRADDVPLQQWHVIRFIWTATTHANMADNTSQEHITLCLQDLQKLMSLAGNPTIILPNNAALPEISFSAVDQEISRISTRDFFTSVFNDDSKDPIGVIESLEPILEPCNQPSAISPTSVDGSEQPSPISIQTQQLIEFLESGDASLRLFLWRRLRDAYIAIDYPPKVLSCYLRSIEVIVSELLSQRHIRLTTSNRQLALLKWFKELDDIIDKLLHRILADSEAFEVVDEPHLQSSFSKIARLSRILHSIVLYEDAVRVGQLSEPKGKNVSGTKSLDKFRDKLRDMYVRIWTLQYTLLREGIAQMKDHFENAADDQAAFLQSLHHALGLRGYCKHSSKIFLRLLKSELMTLNTKDDYSADMAQVLFDLHQLRFAPGIGDWNHDCPPEPLDRKSAAHILENVVLQARKMNIKDLLKSELKSTIEKVQQALGAPKSSPTLSYNRRIINAYLKSPVNQLQLFRASRGEGSLPVRIVQAESVTIAAYGWYFLLGHIALAKFKSIKRTNPGPTDDLDIAITFLKQDLEHDTERWETWFRLAQVYDAKIEEELLWTADKVNNCRSELAILQRNAIHCYEMAMAMSIRGADDTEETANMVSEMYTGFATRLYASSREPLSMDAFDTKHQQRHFTGSNEQSGLYEGPSTPSMRMFAVWRFSAHLLRRALADKPRSWINHYMLGKCLWKMLTNTESESPRRVLVEEVLDAFSDAIENLPGRKDSRADPILEPHFKLVSVVHKLVHRKMLTPLQGSEALQVTPWARNVHLAEEDDSWEPYVLEILKKLGHADKSNWHHRIIARAAHVIYDDQQTIAGALGAKHEFTQQIFTKTMTLQVWKPEHERAGRHFIYTSRYVLFFVSLLNQLNDRASLDQLVRRIRRRPGDYLNHQQVWEQVVTTYIGLLRRLAKVPVGHEEAVFRAMDHDEFQVNARKLESHAHDPETSNLVLDILRDTIEVKKLNNSLMKGSLIDDLIVDCYTSLYQSYVATLPQEEKVELMDSQTIQHEVVQDDGNRERMKLGSILTAQTDGNMDLPGPGSRPTAPALPTVGPSGMPAPPPKPARHKTVTRREVQRKAEGLIIRPPPIKTPTLLKHTAFPRPPIAVEVPPSSSKHVRSSSTMDNEAINVGLGLGPIEGSRILNLREDAVNGTKSAESSRPGSVHDSADDESELSELEEGDNVLDEEMAEEDRVERFNTASRMSILFPGLPSKVSENDESSVVISDSESARNERPEDMTVDENVEGGNESNMNVINAMGEDTMKE
ncbi:hypothetical protein GJ744_002113 [Endocarpon pusillum]|uniref:Histone transcription regulator 3 homolog n=1 Tax=Endocarpon pusillum TaxID=364733 RepID=A0A8H7AB83_9EURO|nr:hypothetical protein GJ744_002113 [Endocarpon pusillum]